MRSRFIIAALLLTISAQAQRTAVYTNSDRNYMIGREYYDANVSGAAIMEFEKFLLYESEVYQPNNTLLSSHAEFAKAQSAVRMGLPEAEKLVLDFIKSHESDPIATQAKYEIASYYFASREYDKALEYFSTISPQDLSKEELTASQFKQGYAHFLKKDFAQAESSFQKIRSIKGEYYYPANYYHGMCRFIEGDYNGAVQSFERAGKSEIYKKYVPYYTTLLFFALRDFDEVIAYGEPQLTEPNLFKEVEMRHLIGQAYFETGQYEKALPFMEAYAASVEKLSSGELYQLGFAQYQTGDCPEASETFKELSSLENPTGQRANFYIADCNLKSGDMRVARNAFRSVSKMDFDPALQEEALFNYGKLSAELSYDKEAIQTLDGIPESSTHYKEAQRVLDDVFSLTQDFGSALSTLEEFETLSPTLQRAYQRLSFMRGIQLVTDGNLKEADVYFVKCAKYPINVEYSAQAAFWRAEIAHIESRFQDSRALFEAYFPIANKAKELPIACSLPLANYSQGYNYLRDKNYVQALKYFERAIDGFNTHSNEYVESIYTNQLIPDTYVRAGDCYFKSNNYNKANNYYDKAIAQSGSIYAKYQKAIILGLTQRPLDKVVLLEEIVNKHSDSQYADNALFQLAITYLELQSSEKSLPALNLIITDYPSSELRNTAYLRMGLISYNNGDLNSALDHYKAVFKSNPSPNEAQEALTALEEIYITDLAKPDDYFAFAETIPGYEVSAFRRDSVNFRTAEIQYENAQYSKAVISFADYLKKFPGGTNRLAAHYYRAESFGLLKEYDNALREYDAVVVLGPSLFYQKALRKAASLSYHSQEDFITAYSYYKELESITTDTKGKFDAQLGMMRSAYRVEQWDDARNAGKNVLEYPEATKEEMAEAHYCVAKSSYDIDDLDFALTNFNEVTKFSNNALTAEARYLIALIYFKRNQLDLSEQMCHNANADNSNYPFWVAKGLILLSDIYLAREDFFNAKAPLEALIEGFQGDALIIEEATTKLANVKAQEQLNSRLKAESDTLELDDDGNE